MMTFLDRIQQSYENFTPGFRKIADHILTHTLDVAFMTREELAQCVGVDPTTILRFAQEIGYEGFRELEAEVKQYCRAQLTESTAKITADVTNNEELMLALEQNAQTVLAQFATTSTKSLTQMLEVLREASHVWVVGEFVMYELARLFAKELEFLGRPATAFSPGPFEIATYLAMMEPGQVLLALNVGHLGIDTGYAVRLAREKGVTTLCLAGNGTTLPAREAEISIVTPTNNASLRGTMIVPLVVLGLLWEALAFGDPEHIGHVLTDVFSNIGQLRALRTQLS